VKEIFTVGGRVGYAWQNWMFYGSGGYATGYVSTRLVSIATQIEAPGFATSVRQDGWYAGAGLDYMAWKGALADLIVGIDYKHYDLGTAHHCNGGGIPCGFVSTNEHDIGTSGDIAVARLTLKFNPWGAPAVVAKY
jgi:outer membrane immunogenic protein